MEISSFHDILQRLSDAILIGLQPSGLLKAARRIPLDGPGGVKAAYETLAKVGQVSQIYCTDEVKVAVANAIVDKTNPVDVYFQFLPTPEEHEMFQLTLAEWYANDVYDLAFSVFMAFASVYGQERIITEDLSDPILAFLFARTKEIAAVNDVLSHAYGTNHRIPGFMMYPKLLHLVWSTGVSHGTADLAPYSMRTQSLLKYFSWIVLGRKDATCMVAKPWEAFPELRPSPITWIEDVDEDLSRLPATQTAFEPDTEELLRRARLFQVTFNQFLMSCAHATRYSVMSSSGIVSVRCNSEGKCDERYEYVGKTPYLDLTRPVVRAALHNSGCAVTTSHGSSLVELFFRRCCTSIHVLEFLPRNAAITVESDDSAARFNMEPFHKVLLLMTSRGDEFVLDPSGGQFGWEQTLAPADEYNRRRVDWPTKFETHIAPARPNTPIRDTPRPNGGAESDWLGYCIAEDIEELTEAYFEANGGLDCVLGLPESQFDDHCLAFEAILKSEMRPRDEARHPYLSCDSEDE